MVRFLVVSLMLARNVFAQTFQASFDGYYGYNFNRPLSRTNALLNFDFNYNQFSLNYAELAVEKKPEPIGFRADVGFGDAARWIHLSEPAATTTYQHIQQAFVSPSKRKIQVDAGKFVTVMGPEVMETKDNWNYSRSLRFSWAVPAYHFGLRTTINLNGKISVQGQLLNGWNNVKDNNVAKTVSRWRDH